MSGAATLRALLDRDSMLVAPGAYDCITARLVEQAGFDAVYMTGAGTAATLGYPDYGLTTMTEMVDNARRMTDVLSVPLVTDADTGFGNELNMARTVRAYARAGVAALHLEDQAFPKKCGHLENKQVIPADDWLAKIRAAVGERGDGDLLVIARTDSRAVLGLDEAVRRSNLALAAGADMVFLEAPESLEEIEAIPSLVRGRCLLNLVRGGIGPLVSLSEAERFGYRMAIVPGMLFAAVVGTSERLLKELRDTGLVPVPPGDLTIKEAFRRFGSEEWDGIAARYAPPVAPTSGQGD